MSAWPGSHIDPTGGFYQIGNPVSCQEQRFQPFDAQNSRPRRPSCTPKSPKPALQPQAQLLGLVSQIQRSSDLLDVAPDAGEIPGRQRQNPGLTVHYLGQSVDLAISNGAHLAEPLGNDEVRPKLSYLPGVKRNDREARLTETADLRIDGSARDARIDCGRSDSREILNPLGIVTLV